MFLVKKINETLRANSLVVKTFSALAFGLTAIFSLFLYLFRFSQILNSLLFEQILISVGMAWSLSILMLFLLKGKVRGLFKEGSFRLHYIYLSLVIAGLIFLAATSSILNIDRSRSFYVLSWVDRGLVGTSGSHLDLSDVKSSEALDVQAIAQRLNEQLSRGLVVQKAGRLRLSSRGKLTLSIANFFGKFYKLQGWNSNRE